MAHITLDIPAEKIPLLMEVAAALGLETENMVSKEKSPEWHQYILTERLEKYNSGKAVFSSWEDIKKEMDSEDKTV